MDGTASKMNSKDKSLHSYRVRKRSPTDAYGIR